ncbi:MAG: hypothetical protein LBR69_04110 [Endomicrobium sp.]|jgi:hypothetical protein|nr:hypothetical protein [Endomicrobium sp.]
MNRYFYGIIVKAPLAVLAAALFFSYAYADDIQYNGEQTTVAAGDTLILYGDSPFNNILANINDAGNLTGTISVLGRIDSYQQIFIDNLIISSGGFISADLSQDAATSVLRMSSKTVVNNGVFMVTGDGSVFADRKSDISFTGAGEILLNGSALDIINTAVIEQSTLTIAAGKLTANFEDLRVNAIINNGSLQISSGNINRIIYGTGNLILDSLITNVSSSVSNSIRLSYSQVTVQDAWLAGNIVAESSGNTIAFHGLFSGIDADMTGFGNVSGNTVNLTGGILKLGPAASFFTGVTFNMLSDTLLDMTNGKIDSVSVDLNLPDSVGPSYVSIDADLRNRQADNFLGSALGHSSGSIVISQINILNVPKKLGGDAITVEIADDPALMSAITLDGSQKIVMGEIFQYYADYGNGLLNFRWTSDYNPSVFIVPVTMQIGGFLGQLNSYAHGLQFLENVISGDEKERKGLWVRPYGYNEDVPLNSGLTVSNNAYGVYFGYDSASRELGRYDMYGSVSLYGSYNGSAQKYEGAEINQDGGIFGVSAALYKERFFAGFTANIGIISEHGQGPSGKDNFMMYTKGMSAKAGYKIDVSGGETFKLLPTLGFSYSSIETAPYTHGRTKVAVDGGFAPLHLEPALRFSAELDDNFRTYADVSYVWSFMDNAVFMAGDTELPQLSIEPYLQYGVGLSKILGENLSASAEIYGRGAGRRGVGGHLNVRWSFGGGI